LKKVPKKELRTRTSSSISMEGSRKGRRDTQTRKMYIEGGKKEKVFGSGDESQVATWGGGGASCCEKADRLQKKADNDHKRGKGQSGPVFCAVRAEVT